MPNFPHVLVLTDKDQGDLRDLQGLDPEVLIKAGEVMGTYLMPEWRSAQSRAIELGWAGKELAERRAKG